MFAFLLGEKESWSDSDLHLRERLLREQIIQERANHQETVLQLQKCNEALRNRTKTVIQELTEKIRCLEKDRCLENDDVDNPFRSSHCRIEQIISPTSPGITQSPSMCTATAVLSKISNEESGSQLSKDGLWMELEQQRELVSVLTAELAQLRDESKRIKPALKETSRFEKENLSQFPSKSIKEIKNKQGFVPDALQEKHLAAVLAKENGEKAAATLTQENLRIEEELRKSQEERKNLRSKCKIQLMKLNEKVKKQQDLITTQRNALVEVCTQFDNSLIFIEDSVEFGALHAHCMDAARRWKCTLTANELSRLAGWENRVEAFERALMYREDHQSKENCLQTDALCVLGILQGKYDKLKALLRDRMEKSNSQIRLLQNALAEREKKYEMEREIGFAEKKRLEDALTASHHELATIKAKLVSARDERRKLRDNVLDLQSQLESKKKEIVKLEGTHKNDLSRLSSLKNSLHKIMLVNNINNPPDVQLTQDDQKVIGEIEKRFAERDFQEAVDCSASLATIKRSLSERLQHVHQDRKEIESRLILESTSASYDLPERLNDMDCSSGTSLSEMFSFSLHHISTGDLDLSISTQDFFDRFVKARTFFLKIFVAESVEEVENLTNALCKNFSLRPEDLSTIFPILSKLAPMIVAYSSFDLSVDDLNASLQHSTEI